MGLEERPWGNIPSFQRSIIPEEKQSIGEKKY
jgi:hypothetical protein